MDGVHGTATPWRTGVSSVLWLRQYALDAYRLAHPPQTPQAVVIDLSSGHNLLWSEPPRASLSSPFRPRDQAQSSLLILALAERNAEANEMNSSGRRHHETV